MLLISIDLRVCWRDDRHDMEPVSNIEPANDNMMLDKGGQIGEGRNGNLGSQFAPYFIYQLPIGEMENTPWIPDRLTKTKVLRLLQQDWLWPLPLEEDQEELLK